MLLATSKNMDSRIGKFSSFEGGILSNFYCLYRSVLLHNAHRLSHSDHSIEFDNSGMRELSHDEHHL